MKSKIITVILILVFLGTAIFVCAEDKNQTKEEKQKKLSLPPSAELPEVSPAQPIEKEGQKPSSIFILADPVIANPAEEE